MLYLIRHGQTDWNLNNRLQGQTDIPLNETGRQMARDAREKYKNLPIDICYSSPLVRAYETGMIFLEGRNVPIIKDDRLIEISFGEYDGMQAREAYDAPYAPFFYDTEHFVPGRGGESFEELFERTGEFLNETIAPLMMEGKNVLIAGHGAMNLAIYSRLKSIPLKDFWDYRMENAAVYEIDWKP